MVARGFALALLGSAAAHDASTEQPDAHALLQRNLAKARRHRVNVSDQISVWENPSDEYTDKQFLCSGDMHVSPTACPAAYSMCRTALQDIKDCWDEWQHIPDDDCRNKICYAQKEADGLDTPVGKLCAAWMIRNHPSCIGQGVDRIDWSDACMDAMVSACDGYFMGHFVKNVREKICVTEPELEEYCSHFASDQATLGNCPGVAPTSSTTSTWETTTTLPTAQPGAGPDSLGTTSTWETTTTLPTAQPGAGPDSCEWASDGECDEPEYCAAGTDTTDCSSHLLLQASPRGRSGGRARAGRPPAKKSATMTSNSTPIGTKEQAKVVSQLQQRGAPAEVAMLEADSAAVVDRHLESTVLKKCSEPC